MSSIGERIKKRRKQLKLSADQLGKMIGKNRATIYRYENNEIENMPYDVIVPLAKALNVSPSYLMGWDDMEPENISSVYPYLPVSISAGLPIDVDPITSDEVETISIPDSIMGKWAGSKDIFIMRVNGDSMDKIIPHDSLIAVRQVELSQLKDGDIVVYSDGTEYALKLFYNDKINQKLIFRPASTDTSFTDYIVPYSESENVKIHGKVVLYIVELD